MKDRTDTAIPALPVVGHVAGDPVHQITLRHNGAIAQVLTWGAVIADLRIPCPDGRLQRVVLGFDNFADYPAHSPYFGAVVGRYANRISGGGFTLNGAWHAVAVNEGSATCLHGGAGGFAHRNWTLLAQTVDSVTLGLQSQDGDQGFPGELTVRCTYTLCEQTTLRVVFWAQTTAPTVVNLAQHTYFNLDGSPDVNEHCLQVFADTYTPVDAADIPSGALADVTGTQFDLRQPRPVFDPAHPTKLDHNFVLSNAPGPDGMRHAARLTAGALNLDVHTTKPGVQVYDGNKLNVAVPGLDGKHYGSRAGMCLETQYFPDSPNQPAFPSSVLNPAETYEHTTDYRFSSRGSDAKVAVDRALGADG